MSSLSHLLLVLCLWGVQALQCLSAALLPAVSFLLTRVVNYLERRREEQRRMAQAVAGRARADRTAVWFVGEKEGVYCQLKRRDEMGKGTWVWSICIGG